MRQRASYLAVALAAAVLTAVLIFAFGGGSALLGGTLFPGGAGGGIGSNGPGAGAGTGPGATTSPGGATATGGEPGTQGGEPGLAGAGQGSAAPGTLPGAGPDSGAAGSATGATLTLVDYSRLYEAAAPSVVAVVSYTRDDVTGEPGLLRWGTGFVADEKGLIFTNAHVVERAALVTILFADGRSYSVKASPPGLLVDKLSDLALVDLAASLEAGGESISVKALPLGDSDRVAVGQPVLAIGNPATMRLRNTLTAGIVSGVGRGLGGFYSFIQTDAAINPGSSGGPLLNLRGEVIGITSMKFVDASLEGLAFAIPINTAQAIARELAQSGRVSRPWLGVVIEESWEARIGLPSANGLYVGAVETGSPAGAAGLIAGDFITGVDDRPVRSVQELNDALISHKVGEILKLTVWRPAGTMVIPVVLMERPAYLDG